MKYLDIPKFPIPTYTVTMMWHYLETELQDWKKDIGLELNPYFQRGHVWTEKQQRNYIEFVFRGGMSGKDIYFNCKGWMTTFEGPIICIDGLQRLTAVRRFMRNELAIFKGNYSKDFTGIRRVPLEVAFIFHVNSIKSERDILRWYLWMNSGSTPHTDEELDRIKKLLNKEENKID